MSSQPMCFTCKVRPAGNDSGGPHSAYCAECQPRNPEAYAKLSLKKYRPIAARNEDAKVPSGLR
jgi:hypothetical protein